MRWINLYLSSATMPGNFKGKLQKTMNTTRKRIYLLVLGVTLAGSVGSAYAGTVSNVNDGAFTTINGSREFQLDSVIERMRIGEPISHEAVSAFSRIARGGNAEFGHLMSEGEARQLAGLLDRYGQADVANSLREGWGLPVSRTEINSRLSANNAADASGQSRFAPIENPTGSLTRIEGGRVSIQDPAGGHDMRNIAKSCFYKSALSQSEKPSGPQVQELTPPGPLTWNYLVEDHPKDGPIIDRYQIESIIFDSNESLVQSGRFQTYVYGRKIEKHRFEDEQLPDGTTQRVGVVIRVNEPPSWFSAVCSLSAIRA